MTYREKIINLMKLIDYTSLNNTDTPSSITSFLSPLLIGDISPAAVCLYPQFIPIAAEILQTSKIKVAAVTNFFPIGTTDLEKLNQNISFIKESGANEVDIVLPKNLICESSPHQIFEFLSHIRKNCPLTLKVILETGILENPDLIIKATQECCRAKVNFVKTSTGKVAVGATFEAVEIMAKELSKQYKISGYKCGLKVSGGVRKPEDAFQFLDLIQDHLPEWKDKDHIRFGASSLWKSCFEKLDEFIDVNSP